MIFTSRDIVEAKPASSLLFLGLPEFSELFESVQKNYWRDASIIFLESTPPIVRAISSYLCFYIHLIIFDELIRAEPVT